MTELDFGYLMRISFSCVKYKLFCCKVGLRASIDVAGLCSRVSGVESLCCQSRNQKYLDLIKITFTRQWLATVFC